jgi:hypothetical protein
MKASFMILPMLLLSAKARPGRTVEAKPEAETGSPVPSVAESADPATSAAASRQLAGPHAADCDDAFDGTQMKRPSGANCVSHRPS